MAHLILEENEPGIESAYIEFNPSNETALRNIEMLLKERHAKNRSTVEQVVAIADDSMQVSCDPQPATGWLTRTVFIVNDLLLGKACSKNDNTCRCGKRKMPNRFSPGITNNKLSMAS